MSATVTATCPKCSEAVDENDLYCQACGAALKGQDDGAAVPATAPGPLGTAGPAGTAGSAGTAAGPTGPPSPLGAPAPATGDEIGGVDGPTARFEAQPEPSAAVDTGPGHRPGVVVVDVELEALPLTCSACSGPVATDGYCGTCGAKAVLPRDHWVERPAPWVAMACDRGIRHAINQDAGAVAATAEPGSFAAIVICDGVSSAARSEVASLAAVRAAREVLITLPATPATRVGVAAGPDDGGPPTVSTEAVAAEIAAAEIAAAEVASDQPASGQVASDQVASDQLASGQGAPATVPVEIQPPADLPLGSSSSRSKASVLTGLMRAAGAAAQQQALDAAADPPEHNPPACTFVAAVIEGRLLVTGCVGDSRAYWFPDAGPAQQVSSDDSWAGEAIAAGHPRAEAENSPMAHSITRWLGCDAPDPVPHTVARQLDEPGWVLLCSDGLWNYWSEAADLHERLLAAVAQVGQDGAALAELLVAWANDKGGHDNITVALARID